MRKKILSILFVNLIGITFIVAQKVNPNSSKVISCSEFHETIPVRDMPAQTDAQRIAAAANQGKIEERAEAMRPKFKNFKKQAEQPDPIAQKRQGVKALTSPLVNFSGMANQNAIPPDPNGAIGPTQYVQMINTSYKVFNKSGLPLTAAIDLTSIFPGSTDDGDPIVLYDKFADRWFISEFSVSKAPYGIRVAISKTGDATGAYYTYTFTNAEWTSSMFPDYPKYSIWTDGYYMTAQFNPEAIMVLDRTRMLAGKSSAAMILTATPANPSYFGGNNGLYTSAKTFDCDAPKLPAYGTPNYMVFFENTNSGGASNMIKFYQLTHDTAAKTLTVTKWDSIAPASFNSYFTGGTEKDITQPGAANSLDALDGTFNFRVPFLTFSGYNSILLSNTVNTGSLVAGIRWYEIRQDPTTHHFSIYQQGTYAPADGASRWNASMAMDKNGNIALEYSKSSSTIYPSICYTGRMATDPLNTMTGAETTVIFGTSPAASTVNRWGDYSSLSVDPSDTITFWGTNEYDSVSKQASRIFSFRLASSCNLSVTTSSPSLICNQGTAIALPANGTSPYTYSWSPSGGTKDTAANLSSGIYKCIVTDALGCKDSASQTVTVATTPTVIVSGKSTMCSGDTAKLSVSGASSYTWKPTAGLSVTTGATVIASPIKTITYTVIGKNGACTDSNFITLTVNTLPSVIFSGKTTICAGTTDTLTASGGTSYTWSTAGTYDTIMVTPLTNKTYSISVSNGTCIKDTSIAIIVTPLPSLSVAGRTAICPGNTDTLIASGATSYHWSTGGTYDTIIIQPGSTATYTLSASKNSCAKNASYTVTVGSYPSVLLLGKATICSGAIDTITASGGTKYIWSTGGTNDTIITHLTSTNTLTLTVANGACLKDTSIKIVVNPIPVLSITGDSIICGGNSTTLTVSGAASYTWAPSGNTNTSITVSPAATTIYSVTGISSACPGFTTKTVTVTPYGGFDLAGNLQVCIDTPSFNGASIQACIYNNRCLMVSGKLKLILDTAFRMTSITADSAVRVNGDTLIWNYDSLSTGGKTYCVNLNGTVSNIPAGDSVFVSMFITPTVGDSNPANNSVTYWVKAFPYNCVGLPFDPNEKSVTPIGDIADTQKLTYTIHFQNTGTAIAHNVVVIDTLNANLDPTTLKVLSASSNMTTQIVSGHIIKFIFDGINLPDTATSKTTSIGVFSFSIKPASSVTAGDKITNNAGIYFDANPAIITNKTVNIIAGGPLSIQTLPTPLNIACFPNPFTTSTSVVFNTDGQHYLDLYDAVGRKIESMQCNGKQYELQRGNLAAGIYFIKAYNANGGYVATSKIVVQ